MMRRVGTWTLLAVLGAATLAGAAGGQGAALTRSDDRGGVAVKATIRTAAYFKANPQDPLAAKVDTEREVVFAVALDTHAGDLSAYDVLKNMVLRNDRGVRTPPVRWVATADGSHHRSGGLVFPRMVGGRAIDRDAGALELVVRDLGGVPERVLRWTLPLD